MLGYVRAVLDRVRIRAVLDHVRVRVMLDHVRAMLDRVRLCVSVM